MGNRSAKNAGREGGIAPGTVADSAGQYFGLLFVSWADANADGMIKVIDSATRESCGGKQMRL
jgi:hypothetical protein